MTNIKLYRSDDVIHMINNQGLKTDVTRLDPSDLLAGAMAKCVESTVRSRAKRLNLELKELAVRVDLHKDESTKSGHFKVRLDLAGNLSDQEIKKLHKSAKKSYIRRLLSRDVVIQDDIHYNGSLLERHKNMTDIIHDEDANRFIWRISESEQAHIDYRIVDGIYHLVHSEVPQALRGQGYGKKLVDKTFEYIKSNNIKAKPICTYIKLVVMRDDEWSQLIV